MNSPHRMRRQARRIRRGGMQPMMLITGNDQFPQTAGVLILRWLWRYRSELTPLYAVGAVLGVACWLHVGHRHWWVLVLAIAAMTAAALAAFGRRAGLPTPAERLYAAVTTLAAGGWMAAATIAGPFATPMPQLLAIGGVVLAVPWWAHARRRARVRVERKLEAWPEIAQAIGLAGSQVMSAVVDVWGWRARFRLARGQTITDVIARIPALESGLGTFRGAVRVYPTPDDLANRCELRVLDMDPHADAIPWPGPSITSITQPIDFGPFEDATPCRVLFLRRHGLAGGATGGGKSGWLNVLMGNLAACRDVIIWAIDMKKGMELGPWAPCIDRLATTPEEARALLADAVAILEARAVLLAARGQRVWEPSPDMPALIILIDEYAELVDDAPGAVKDADSIARRGRAVAVNLIAATQRPTQKAMGQGAVRSQMDVRVCFRVRERKDVDLILGQGMLAAGWNAHTLNAPGKFLIAAAEHDTPRRARAYLLSDEAVTGTASRYAHSRPPLDEVSQQAIGEHWRAGPPDTPRQDTPQENGEADNGSPRTSPEAMLWAALCLAPDEGVPVPDLMRQTGMGRRWVYYRLTELAAAGRATQVTRGQWRATLDGGDDE
jgi:S-DNA-T family DNA segregation ATPase FtsK/SpoIIIE